MDREAAKQRIEELTREIRAHDHAYYVLDRPKIADTEYDRLFRELRRLEEDHPDLLSAASPTQRVAGRPVDGFRSVEHTAPMLSLDSDASEEALLRFDERIRKALGEEESPVYVLEPKLDGASVELVYDDGLLTEAATRGDGRRGEGILENARTIAPVPLRLRDDVRPVPRRLSLRGEVIMRLEDFDRQNEELVLAGKEPYANPRNAAAGALRQLDPRRTAERTLDIYLYDLLSVDGAEPILSQWEVLEALREWGLRVNDLPRRAPRIEDAIDYHRDLKERRDDLPYEIDGVVIKLDSMAARERLGTTSHHPRWAFAYKFPPRREITRLLSILPSVGRTGVVTPVALMRPVELGGVTVSRATLHNREEVARKDVREGDLIRIQRAGDVIPQVVERIEEENRERGEPFRMPVRCPSCDTRLTERGPFSVCPNSFDCPAQLVGRLVHLGSRNALDIEGLGEETARLLIDEGLVRHLPDLFDLDPQQLLELAEKLKQEVDAGRRPRTRSFAEKSAGKLVANIGEASRVELSRLLYGLGIPEVGTTVARALAGHFGEFEAVRSATEEELQEVDGIGPRMAEQIVAFFAEEHNRKILAELLDGRIEPVGQPKTTPKKAAGPLAGKRVVLTGALEAMSRSEAQRRLEAAGAQVTSAVSGKTDYLVAGAEPGSKMEKARDLGVEVIDEAGLAGLLAS